MGKYDSPRKSLPSRHSAAAPAPQPNYVPSVSRVALDEEAWREARGALPGAAAAVVPVSAVSAAFEQIVDVTDALVEETEEPETLPVPEMGVPKESMIRARHAGEMPKTSVKVAIDPMAMLEAATVWGGPKTRR